MPTLLRRGRLPRNGLPLLLLSIWGIADHGFFCLVPGAAPGPNHHGALKSRDAGFRAVEVAIPNASTPESADVVRFVVYEASVEDSRDTYGSQLWPAAVCIASDLLRMPEIVEGARVLELGCGNGLCSLAAASLEVRSVLATDYRQFPLDLLRKAADTRGAKVSEKLETRVLDFADPMPSAVVMSTRHRAEKVPPLALTLPDHDVLVAADVGYSKALAWRLGEHCRESLKKGRRVLVCESRQMPECRLAFSEALNLGRERVHRLQSRTPLQVETGALRCRESIPSLWYLDATGG